MWFLFCFRAAAFSKLNKNSEAIADCKRALQIDPQYSKAYGRMGYVELNVMVERHVSVNKTQCTIMGW